MRHNIISTLVNSSMKLLLAITGRMTDTPYHPAGSHASVQGLIRHLGFSARGICHEGLASLGLHKGLR